MTFPSTPPQYRTVNGVAIRYQLLGKAALHPPSPSKLTPIVFTPGGQGGLDACELQSWLFEDLPDTVGMVWDRRNTGASDFSIDGALEGEGSDDGVVPEPQLQADDLCGLLDALGYGKVILVGNSSGARMSLLFALKYPSRVKACILMNMTGGHLAADVLSNEYYIQYATRLRRGGIPALLNTPFFRALCSARPENRARIEQMDAAELTRVFDGWAGWISGSGDCPVIGVGKEQIASLSGVAGGEGISYMVVHFMGHGDSDGMHKTSVSEALAGLLPEERTQLVVSEMPTVWIRAVRAFIQTTVGTAGDTHAAHQAAIQEAKY